MHISHAYAIFPLKYATIIRIVTAANTDTQDPIVRIYNGLFDIRASLVVSKAVQLFVKHVLGKRRAVRVVAA